MFIDFENVYNVKTLQPLETNLKKHLMSKGFLCIFIHTAHD